jgi:hypothetical protein
VTRDELNPSSSGDLPVSPPGFDRPVPGVVGALFVDLAEGTNRARVIEELAEWERRYRQYRQIETGDDPLAGVDGETPSHRVPVDGAVLETIIESVLADGKHRVPRRLVAVTEEL